MQVKAFHKGAAVSDGDTCLAKCCVRLALSPDAPGCNWGTGAAHLGVTGSAAASLSAQSWKTEFGAEQSELCLVKKSQMSLH